MLKLIGHVFGSMLLAMGLSGPGHAAILGPDAAMCEAGRGQAAILVKISGFKARTGIVRVQSYGGDPAHYFDKGSYLKRIDVRQPFGDPAEICIGLPKPGTYAISVRHDVNGDGKADSSDGGGMSGNPNMSLLDIVFKNKPKPSQVAVQVGAGVTVVPVVLRYVQGGSFKPIAGTR